MVNVTIYSSTMDSMGPSISDWFSSSPGPAPGAQSWPAAFQNLHQTLTSEVALGEGRTEKKSCQVIFPLKIVIFNSYVKLPEGKIWRNTQQCTCREGRKAYQVRLGTGFRGQEARSSKNELRGDCDYMEDHNPFPDENSKAFNCPQLIFMRDSWWLKLSKWLHLDSMSYRVQPQAAK